MESGLRPPSPIRDPGDVPESLRAKLVALVDSGRNGLFDGAMTFGVKLAQRLGRLTKYPSDMKQIAALIEDLSPWEICDCMEALVDLSKDRPAVAGRVESLLAQEGMPYAMRDTGRLAWRFSPAALAVQEQVSTLLAQPGFAGPLQQWEKALSLLSGRPPDPENCIKDAVSALEGVGRILSGKPHATFSDLVKDLAQQLNIHPTLREAMSKIYAYRGDVEGVAHSQTQPSTVTVEDAEFVLHTTGAAITYCYKRAQTMQKDPGS